VDLKLRQITDRAQEHFDGFRNGQTACEAMYDRSLEMYNLGHRTTRETSPFWPMDFGEGPLSNFLMSCYNGGRYTVITTDSAQYLMLTEELDPNGAVARTYQAGCRRWQPYTLDGPNRTQC
jgi:hypothetical protein